MIVGHRGAAADAPENTVISAQRAWEQGADAVEIDVHASADGHVVVIHDDTLKRTVGRSAPVASLPLAELRELEAGRWKGPEFVGARIPTLDEIIATIPEGGRLFVEIKVGPEIVPEIRRVLEATGAGPERITIISFHRDTLQAVRKFLPAYPALWLIDDPQAGLNLGRPPKRPAIGELIAAAKQDGLAGLSFRHSWPLQPAEADPLRAQALELHVWTVNDPEVARRWISLGAASITTDRPGWLREQLDLRRD
jgi:glycerophosphoryl diester phosphodiesterase